jgi:hypothetical protein
VAFDSSQIDVRRQAAQPRWVNLEAGSQKALFATEQHNAHVEELAALNAGHDANNRVAIPHGA